eukprot:CAMPEP_0181533814 /NCGR_PEP_ID=MMETSP1110-20121109/73365_1 /TAXON_ID=174948 /ORGANISM="Symbiodinium sp., Strain CCMP421" /LENGTH=112 /DNA_ID=CAMNT_0023665037 /DNA_START=231 /DNA_END=565 /DNA_ORIENTATION=+
MLGVFVALTLRARAATAVRGLAGPGSRALIFVIGHPVAIIILILHAILAAVPVKVVQSVRHEVVLLRRERTPVHFVLDSVVVPVLILDSVLATVAIKVRGPSGDPARLAALL